MAMDRIGSKQRFFETRLRIPYRIFYMEYRQIQEVSFVSPENQNRFVRDRFSN